jgi:hypothetical protein
MVSMRRLSTLAGDWAGSYQYPPGAGGPWGETASVPFEMRLNQIGYGRLSGEIREDPALGFPEPGVVQGRASLFSVVLQKRMPVLRLWVPGALMTFREWILKTYGPDVHVNDLEHPVIQLKGRLSRWSGTMAGTWSTDPFGVADEGTSWRLDFPRQTGTWHASRTSLAV